MATLATETTTRRSKASTMARGINGYRGVASSRHSGQSVRNVIFLRSCVYSRGIEAFSNASFVANGLLELLSSS